MTGHGIRFAALEQGASQAIATLCACLAIGIMAGIAADRRRLPFAAVAFAAAVPMLPGSTTPRGRHSADTPLARPRARGVDAGGALHGRVRDRGDDRRTPDGPLARTLLLRVEPVTGWRDGDAGP